MAVATLLSATSLPPVTVADFEGPLDLLLHLIREHRVEVTNIPMVQITDHYLAYLRAMEAMDLTVAGEFFVMAATLLEIKSRILLPKPPKEQVSADEEGNDPEKELVQKLLEYQRYKAFTETLSAWEDARRQLFFREPLSADLFPVQLEFGAFDPSALLKALERLMAETEGEDEHAALSGVRRRKWTLKFAMAALRQAVLSGGETGVELAECFARPLVRAEVVVTFLALLELLRQGLVRAVQLERLGEIILYGEASA